jgi:hypothetical protein
VGVVAGDTHRSTGVTGSDAADYHVEHSVSLQCLDDRRTTRVDWGILSQLGAGEPDAPLQETWLLDPATLSAQGIAKVHNVLGRLDREGYVCTRSSAMAGGYLCAATPAAGSWVNRSVRTRRACRRTPRRCEPRCP